MEVQAEKTEKIETHSKPLITYYEVHFKSNAHTAKNQSNLFIQVNFHITSFNVVPPGFDDTFPAIGKLFDTIK